MSHVREDASPYRHALLHHAAAAVAFQRSRGMLSVDIEFHSSDLDVVCDFDTKPDVQRWLLNAVLINCEGWEPRQLHCSRPIAVADATKHLCLATNLS